MCYILTTSDMSKAVREDFGKRVVVSVYIHIVQTELSWLATEGGQAKDHEHSAPLNL